MNCQTSKEYISQFLDNELSQNFLQPLFLHLGECDECRNFFVQVKSIHDSVKKLSYLPVPESLDQKFSVLGLVKKNEPLMNRKLTVSVPSAIYSLCALVVITLFMYSVGSYQEKSMASQYRQTINAVRETPSGFTRRD